MYPILADIKAILARQRNKQKVWLPGIQEYSYGWDWGWRKHPIKGDELWHNGVDLPSPVGTPIYCPQDGYVKKSWSDAGEENINGNAIRLVSTESAHPEVAGTSYAHLDQRYVQTGDKVKRGDVIGLVGNTGASTGPHLHYVVWAKKAIMAGGKNRYDIDPLPYLDSSSPVMIGGPSGGGVGASILLASAAVYFLLKRFGG
jgi:murein DD-endopeptidase MepM/ murein hydrolase activator NlpD